MRRNFNRHDADLLPTRDTAVMRNDPSKSSKRLKPGNKCSFGRKKVSKTLYDIFINIYLSLIAVFIIYHIDLVKSSLFSTKRVVSTLYTDQAISNAELTSYSGGKITSETLTFENETLYGDAINASNIQELQFSTKLLVNTTHKNINVELPNSDEGKILQTVELNPLRFPQDYEEFTIRINTWKREEQLKISIEHYMTCSAVSQIQVIWCLEQGEPPEWLKEMEQLRNSIDNNIHSPASVENISHPLLVIERHENNSLNERFLSLQEIPTAGVLSVDDDVIRPCIALYAGFLKWSLNPDRQVGFDARSHSVELTKNEDSITASTAEEIWSYAYLSATEKSNKYSITLTRFSFLHRDYLKSYWVDMPAAVRSMVAEQFNCEDIAMSLWISASTGGRPPLLADYWAVKSQIKVFAAAKISATKDHKAIRNKCFDLFGNLFQLKGRLRYGTLYHSHEKYHGFFQYGEIAEDWNHHENDSGQLAFLLETEKFIDRWKSKGSHTRLIELKALINDASKQVYANGLLENTNPWRRRFIDRVE